MQNRHSWHVATSLPNDPWAPTPVHIMSQTRNSNKKLGQRIPPTNLQQTNDWSSAEQTIFAYQEHHTTYSEGMASTPQPKSFQMLAPAVSAFCGTTPQQQLNGSRTGSVVTGSISHFEGPIEARANNATLPFAPGSATTIQSVGPVLEVGLVSGTATPPVTVPTLGHPTLMHEAEVTPYSSTEEIKWLEKFKQFVLSHETGSKIETNTVRKQSGCISTRNSRSITSLVKGSFNVPENQDKSLHRWMRTQRARFEEWTEGTFDMPSYRIEKLNQIGFK